MKEVQLTKSWISDNTELYTQMAKLEHGSQFDRIVTEISNEIKRADRQKLLYRVRECKEDAVVYGKSIGRELERLAS